LNRRRIHQLSVREITGYQGHTECSTSSNVEDVNMFDAIVIQLPHDDRTEEMMIGTLGGRRKKLSQTIA